MCNFGFRQGYGLLTEEIIMYLTDEQIMLLEQLTYLTNDVADAAGVILGPYDSVDDVLQQFDVEALQELENSGKTFNHTGAEKWAAIIRQIKSDPDLYSLDIVNKDDSVPALCFNDPDDPGHAVVVFKGTSGQGFSQEFLDKYYAEIKKKGHCIKNYYLEGDFVSILMFPVPGADQICIDGADSVIGAENHCPSSFYQFYQDEEGKWYIRCDGDGAYWRNRRCGKRT